MAIVEVPLSLSSSMLSDTCPLESALKGLAHFRRGNVVCGFRRKKDQVIPFSGKSTGMCGRSEHPLAPVAKDGVAEPFGGDERDPPCLVVSPLEHSDSHEGVVDPLTPGEDLLKVLLGFDGLHGRTFRR